MIFTKMYGKNRKRICNFINIAKKILVKITTLHSIYLHKKLQHSNFFSQQTFKQTLLENKVSCYSAKASRGKKVIASFFTLFRISECLLETLQNLPRKFKVAFSQSFFNFVIFSLLMNALLSTTYLGN